MKKKRVILWFRQDLRLHDNEALTDALKSGEEVIPVFVFDERVFKTKTSFGFPKTGKFRAKFIIESVNDLRNSLAKLGSKLIIRIGQAEEEIFKIARAAKTSWVFCNRERTRDEVKVQDKLEWKLWTIGQELRFSRGKMLYYTQDLPFPITHTPDNFTHFRKELEKFVPVRSALESPSEKFTPLSIKIEAGEIPTLKDLDYEEINVDKRATIIFKGGETEGLKRLQYYFEETKAIQNYKKTKDELMGENYSSKFSPWLAQGCLSPKIIYAALKKYERLNGANKSTNLFYYKLLWRDFYRLMGKKHEDKIFQKGGPKGIVKNGWSEDRNLFNLWQEGKTTNSFIDANMQELNATGFISNRGRQNVASYLVNDLKLNWQMGAEYFESLLLDYDPCSNWGSWNYIAGVAIDAKEDRQLNISAQAKHYDPEGEYVKQWMG